MRLHYLLQHFTTSDCLVLFFNNLRLIVKLLILNFVATFIVLTLSAFINNMSPGRVVVLVYSGCKSSRWGSFRISIICNNDFVYFSVLLKTCTFSLLNKRNSAGDLFFVMPLQGNNAKLCRDSARFRP